MHHGKRQIKGRIKLRFLKIENGRIKTVQFLWMQKNCETTTFLVEVKNS